MTVNFAPRLTLATSNSEAVQLLTPELVSLSLETDLAALRPLWSEFERSALGHVYQSHGWVSIWNNAIGSKLGVAPHIVLGRAPDGRLLFLLPLGVGRRMGSSALIWMGGSEADLKGGLFAADFLASFAQDSWKLLWARIRRLLPAVDVVHLVDQPEAIGAFPNPFCALKTNSLPANTHATRLGRDWEAYYRSKRNGSARNLEKRRMRQLQAEGEVSFEIARTQEEIESGLAWLLQQKAKALREVGVSDPFADPCVRDFFTESTRNSFPKGTSHLSLLRVDGKPVSGVWGLVHNKRFYYIICVYDAAYSKQSPGRLHLRELLRWAVENGLETFDLGVGEADYKFHWCEEHVPLFATIEACTFRGRGVAAFIGAGTSLKHRIKTSTVLWPAAQAVRTQLGRIGLPQ
jgi:CelD/BcsL family acetyltransferase involved in cellulose biosynthesis